MPIGRRRLSEAVSDTVVNLRPLLMPLGDAAILIRFADRLSDGANRAAIALARRLDKAAPEGVVEIAPGLVSVLVRTRPGSDFNRICGELRLLIDGDGGPATSAAHEIPVSFDGEDADEVAGLLGLSRETFVARHNAVPLRVLATGFAPGFVYCGLHPEALVVPRRESIRLMVPAGSVLFAAGQTAIAATPIRTGWHVIGRTTFQNFDVARDPPTRLQPGDGVRFVAVP
jgi:KipI family sensor histidine kinase inhibitor